MNRPVYCGGQNEPKRESPPREAIQKENIKNNISQNETSGGYRASQAKIGESPAALPRFKEPQSFEKTEQKTEKPKVCRGENEKNKNGKIQNSRGLMGLFEKFLPPGIYNPKTKKLFGLLSGEDVLILALILFFAESEEEESGIIILALVYLLISEKLDLSELF